MFAESSEHKRRCDNIRNKRIRAETDYNRVLNEYVMLKYEPIAQEFSEFYDTLREKYPEKYVYKGAKRFRSWVRSEIAKYDACKNAVEQNANDVSEAANLREINDDTIGAEAVVCAENAVAEAVNLGEINATVGAEAVVCAENVVPEAVNLGEINATVGAEALVCAENVVPEAVNLGEINATIGAEAVVCAENVVPEAVNLGEIIDITIGANVMVQPPLENIIANGQPQELEELDALIGNIIADIESQCDEGISLSPHHELEPEPLYYDGEIEGLDDIDFDIPLNLLEAELNIELENF